MSLFLALSIGAGNCGEAQGPRSCGFFLHGGIYIIWPGATLIMLAASAAAVRYRSRRFLTLGVVGVLVVDLVMVSLL